MCEGDLSVSLKGSPSDSVNIIRWIVLPDVHTPYEDGQSLLAVEKLMVDLRFDGYILIGDFMDFDCISAHNKNNLRAIAQKTVQKDYDRANIILDRHQKIIRANNKRAEFVYIEGNHENRVDRYIDANPAMEGSVEVPLKLNLKARKFKWVPFWSKGEVYKVGKATFIHGRYTNDAHAKKHVHRYGCNVFYGHVHDVQCYSAEMLGEGNTLVGQSLGCLCLPQSYMQGAPDKWQQAFGIFEFFPDGLFTYAVVRIFKHRFSYNGKVYTP